MIAEIERALAVDAAQGSKIAQTDNLDSASQDGDRKAFETLRAFLAFGGYTLSRTNPADGSISYIVARFGLCEVLVDLTAVAAFTRQAGAA